MRYATPTRSAHRAATATGLFPPVRHPIGLHRQPARPRLLPDLRRTSGRPLHHLRSGPCRTADLLTHGLAALIVLGICVMVGVLVIADERRPSPLAVGDQLLGSRHSDPAPLTAEEVFTSGTTAFQASRPRLTTDCSVAVTGALRLVLQGYGCSQAVLAALTVPYADYQITAGMLNLPDAGSATAVGERVRELVVTGDGNFTGTEGAEIPSGTPVVWRTRGHYLMYCVITDAAGGVVPTDDPAVPRITHEVLDLHLNDTVLTPRATHS